MLGIRTYKDFALDLWVGPRQDFYCDLMVSRNPKLEAEDSEVYAFQTKDAFQEFYQKQSAAGKSLRHLAFEVTKGDEDLLLTL